MTTVRVGVLNDMGDVDPGPGDIIDCLEHEIGLLRASGRITSDIEFVHAYGLGLPSGTAEAIEQAYRQLVAQDVVLIVGPAIGDNAIVGTPLAERLRVPTINLTGAERARGKYMFQLQVGSQANEARVIARHLAELGARRLGVVHDISSVGTRHLEYLEDEASALGMAVAERQGISPMADDAGAQVDAVVAARPDAVVYFGQGLSAPAVAQSLGESGWQGHRIMNTAGLRGYQPAFASVCNGWTYIDMRSDGNCVLRSLCEERGIAPEAALAAARGHDLGRLIAEGIAGAHDVSREGVRLGLERVTSLPAAQGEDGTLLGFGVQDRGALHGRYLVLRRWQDGESVEIRRA